MQEKASTGTMFTRQVRRARSSVSPAVGDSPGSPLQFEFCQAAAQSLVVDAKPGARLGSGQAGVLREHAKDLLVERCVGSLAAPGHATAQAQVGGVASGDQLDGHRVR